MILWSDTPLGERPREGSSKAVEPAVELRQPNGDTNGTTHDEEPRVEVLWREANTYAGGSRAWKDGPVMQLRREDDWVNVAHIRGLWPEHQYELALAKPNSERLPYPSEPLSFKTFPDPRSTLGTRLKFVVSSGVRPNFPYAPVSHANRFKGFDILAKYLVPSKEVPRAANSTDSADPLPEQGPSEGTGSEYTETFDRQTSESSGESQPTTTMSYISNLVSKFRKSVSAPVTGQPPAFVLLIGDLVRRRSAFPFKRADINYVQELRNVFASPSFRRIYENIPVYHAFGPSPQLTTSEGSLLEPPEPSHGASYAFGLYSRAASYWGGLDHSYYDFRYGDVAFFVLDTLTYRSLNEAPEAERSLLGAKQLADFFAWAQKVNQTSVYKVVVSPVPLSAMWGNTTASVTWADFPSERARIINMLSYLPNAVVVSGGRHEFAAIEYLEGKIVEVVTGPMSSYAIPGVLSRLDEKNAMVIETVRNETLRAPAEGFDAPNEEDIVVPVVDRRPEEAILHRINGGNYKWSTFDIDTTNKTQPTLLLSVYGSSGLIWSTQIFGQPVTIRTTSAVAAVLSEGLKTVLSKLGFGFGFARSL
ncbi:hypothetical protein FRB99_006249 [Tulasnella sp. 403]|nr:hypothetical protein FRB99_006249 [Tulasnella sp. 403]